MAISYLLGNLVKRLGVDPKIKRGRNVLISQTRHAPMQLGAFSPAAAGFPGESTTCWNIEGLKWNLTYSGRDEKQQQKSVGNRRIEPSDLGQQKRTRPDLTSIGKTRGSVVNLKSNGHTLTS